MRAAAHILQFILAGVIVVILGATAGWYFFVHRAIQTTRSHDASRGLGIAPSFGSPQGSTFANAASGSGGAAIESGGTGATAPRLWALSKSPSAGIGFDATSTRLLFVERATGNVLRADPSVTALVRLTNTLLPKIYDAQFAGQTVLLRSVDATGALTTYAGSIKAATSTGEVGTIDGVYLPQNIIALAPRAKQQLFFLISAPNGGSVGVTSDLKGGAQKRVFVSALSGWRLWGTDDALYIAQKAADDVAGYSFKLGADGSLAPLISGVPGLVIMPRASSTALLWSSSQGGALTLFGRSSATAAPVRLPVKTVAEKCVWAPGAALIAYCAAPRSLSTTAFLTNWYSGTLHTSDSWWKVDVSAGTAEQFYSPDAAVTIDVADPKIDASGSYIAFKNAIDGTPWMLRIAE